LVLCANWLTRTATSPSHKLTNPFPIAQGRLYGETLNTAGDGASSYAFAGEWRDASGLDYLRARYYAPWQGRFLTKDAWEGDYARPLTLNRWNYVVSNPVNLTDPTGMFPEWCRAMPTRLAYENCVRDAYSLFKPKYAQIYPGSDRGEAEWGAPGCWRGPVVYAAAGYLEGISGDIQAIPGLPGFGGGREVVYDFATMERHLFNFFYLGVADQFIAVTATEYHGVAFGFNSSERLAEDYFGPYWFVSVGVGTDFPGQPVGLGTGVTHFAAFDYKIWGMAQYFSMGASAIDVIPGVDIEFGAGKYLRPKGDPVTYFDENTKRVHQSRLINDITFGLGSPAVIPVPSNLFRTHGLAYALYWSWIFEEINIHSR
jgi:RHS repeat-associated protein